MNWSKLKLVCAIGAVAVAYAVGTARAEEETDTMSLRKLILVGSDTKPRIVLDADGPDGPSIRFLDQAGKTKIHIGTDSRGYVKILLFRQRELPEIELFTSKDGRSGLFIFDQKGRKRIVITNRDEISSLYVYGADGGAPSRTGVELRADAKTATAFVWSKEQANMVEVTSGETAAVKVRHDSTEVWRAPK